MGRAITWLSLVERDLWSFDSLTYPYIENQNMLIWLIILIIIDSFWVVWYFSHFSSFTAKYLSAVNAEKPVPKQWDWCDSVRDMQSCSPLWESYLHESCSLSGFPLGMAALLHRVHEQLFLFLTCGIMSCSSTRCWGWKILLKIQEADWENSE